MTTRLKKLTFAFALALTSFLFVANANAACGDSNNKYSAMFHRQSWRGTDALRPGLLLISDRDRDSIVGMWHVTFTAEGNNPGPPDGAPIDNALVTWHADGTELMNSARPSYAYAPSIMVKDGIYHAFFCSMAVLIPTWDANQAAGR